MTCSQFMLLNGTFDTNSQDITCNSIFRTDTGTKTLTLGSSTITISAAGNTIQFYNVDPTITANTATFIILTGSGIAFQAATNMNGASLDIRTNNGGGFTVPASTWANITCTTLGAKPLAFSGNVMVTDTLTLAGTNSTTNRQHIYSSVLGTPRVITAAATSLTDVDFMDIAIVGPTGSTITSDSFDRSNGSLGTSDAATGGSALAWSSDGTWSISSNKASRSGGGGNSFAVVETGTSDQWVQTTYQSGTIGLVARYTDSSNCIYVNYSGSASSLTVLRGGSIVYIAGLPAPHNTAVAGDVITLAVNGNVVRVMKNGNIVYWSVPQYTAVLTQAESTLNGTKAGLSTNHAAGASDDFIVKAIPSVTGTRLGDCLGNSGIEFTTASGTPRDGGGAGVKRYAVAPGNFSSTAMWSETSGGAPGASVPLPQDDVYLDASSAAGTYTIDMTRVCRNLDATGFTRTLAYPSIVTNNFYGSFTLPLSGFTWSGTNTLNMLFRGRSSHTITTPTWPSFANAAPAIYAFGGTYTAGSDLNNLSTFALMNGTLDINNFNWSILTMVAASGTTLNMGNGTLTLGQNSNAGTHWSFSPTATLNGSSSTITLAFPDTAGRSYGFDGGGKVYGTLNHTASGQAGALVITGANTFTALNIGSGRSLKLTSGTTQKIGTLNLNGSPRGGVRFQGVSGTFLSTPDSAAVSVTGDIDIRVRAALTDWTPGASQAFLGKYREAGNQGSYIFAVDSLGRLVYYVTATGVGSSALPSVSGPWVDGATYWVRVSHTTGQLRFFYAPDSSSMPTSWTQLGIDNTIFGLPKYDSTAALEIGAYNNGASMPMTGIIYRVQIRNNVLDNDTGIVFDTDLSVPFGPNFYDTANGAVITPSNTLANVSDGRVVIESVTANSPATLQVDTVTGMNYVDLRDVVMNGADTYIGATSVIRSNVKGVRRGPKTGLGV